MSHKCFKITLSPDPGLSLPLNLYPCFQCYSTLQRSAEPAKAAGSIEAAPFIFYNLSRSFNLGTWLPGWNEDARSWRYVAIYCCLWILRNVFLVWKNANYQSTELQLKTHVFFCQKRLLLLIMYNSNFTNTLIVHPCPCQSPVDCPREKQLLKKPHTFKLYKLKALYYVSNLD